MLDTCNDYQAIFNTIPKQQSNLNTVFIKYSIFSILNFFVSVLFFNKILCQYLRKMKGKEKSKKLKQVVINLFP